MEIKFSFICKEEEKEQTKQKKNKFQTGHFTKCSKIDFPLNKINSL